MQQSDELASCQVCCQKSHNPYSEDGFGDHIAKPGHMNVWFLWICHPYLYCSSKWSTCSHQRTDTFCIKIYATCFWRKKRNQTHMLFSAHDWFGLSVPAIALLHFQSWTSLRSVHQVHWETFTKTKHHVPGCPGKQSCFAQDYIRLFEEHTHNISTIVCTSCPSWNSLHHSDPSECRERHLFFQEFHSIHPPPPPPQNSKIKIQRKEWILAKCLSPEHNQMMMERSDGYVFSFALRWRDTSPLGGLEWPLAGLLFTNSVSSSLEKSDSDIITLLFWILPERKGTQKHFSFTWNKPQDSSRVISKIYFNHPSQGSSANY